MALNEIQRLRLKFGDLNEDCPYLTDEEYQDFITSYPSAKKREKAIDLAILNILSFEVRERSGQEERYANQAFEQRLSLLKTKYKDPAFNGVSAVPLIGGTSVNEMFEAVTNPDRPPDTFYKGSWNGRGEWQDYRQYRYIGAAIEPEPCKWYPLWHLSSV